MGGGGCDLVALTAFYEQHYVCFCFSHTAGQWIHYDDDTRQLIWSKVAKAFSGARCLKPAHGQGFCALAESSRISTLRSLTHRRLLGKDFDSVKEKCIAGRLHPQLLFYESR